MQGLVKQAVDLGYDFETERPEVDQVLGCSFTFLGVWFDQKLMDGENVRLLCLALPCTKQ